MKVRAAKIITMGKVQGVGFRNFVKMTARKLGLFGYAKNLTDGTVETFAEGEKPQLEDLINKIKAGNTLSRVEKVTIEWQDPVGKYKSFDVVK
jgi:acylphosphatase